MLATKATRPWHISHGQRVAAAAHPPTRDVTLLHQGDAASSIGKWKTSEGTRLTAEEAASLRKFLSRPDGPLAEAAEDASGTTMPAATDAAVLLRGGLRKQVKDLSLLEGAMLAEEQASLDAADLEGAGDGGATARQPRAQSARDVAFWQPIFASAGGFPRLLYIPVPEFFDMRNSGAAGPREAVQRLSPQPSHRGKPSNYTDAIGSVDVVTELGPVTTHFVGPCVWADDETVEYWVESCRVEVPSWGWKFTVPFRLHNALTFFYLDAEGGLACARSRLGGTMLLAADPAGTDKYPPSSILEASK